MFTPTLRCECAQPASDRLMRKWCILFNRKAAFTQIYYFAVPEYKNTFSHSHVNCMLLIYKSNRYLDLSTTHTFIFWILARTLQHS